ncbi:kinetochore-associated Ndc80 complex subunit nuf2 [Globomyces sp. JEL0801]|nr:kinetochore-associated Ndc80 complex subunit nuf2 [Globomyces sp. JEL0801]
MTDLTFPVLEASEILLCMQELSIPCQAEDLKKPTHHRMLSLAEEQPRVEQVKQTVTEITKDLRALKQQQNTINNEIEELKKSKSSISEKIMNNSFLITNLKQDCAKLSSRIVTNPEILKNTILDMNQSVQNDKNLLHQSERKNRDLTARIESMVLVDQDIEGCCTLLEQVDQERKRKRENKERLNKENEEFLTKTNQLRELTIKEQQLSRQLKSTNEKMNRLIEHQTQRENMNEAKFNQIKKDYQEILESYNSTLQKSKDMDSTYLDIETKMSVEKKEFEAEMDGLRVNYEKLGVELKKYTNELTSKMSLLQ